MQDRRELDPRPLHADRPTLTAEDSGTSPAAVTWRGLVQPGMYVRGIAGDEIGQVKEVRSGDFLVDRSPSLGLAPDLPFYLPFERIHAIMGDQITLDIPGSEAEEHGTIPTPIDV